jgi:glutaredoxin-related protein
MNHWGRVAFNRVASSDLLNSLSRSPGAAVPLPPRPPATTAVTEAQESFHADVLAEVVAAVATYDVVIIGMAVNPAVGKAREAALAAGVTPHCINYGGYLSQWKQRLAIKLWSGWPTYPQVFVKGTLVGGNARLRKAIADGTFQTLLDGPRAD